ncbi:hypothetical protein HOY82DRAFT_643476 [Tuber indicum]|nr:hypothetical protein HOY82DRAFT_643476 [Tuber indicum]
MPYEENNFYPLNGLTSVVVDSESGRKQQISIKMQKAVKWTEETNYYFGLSALAPRLQEFHRAIPDSIVPAHAIRESSWRRKAAGKFYPSIARAPTSTKKPQWPQTPSQAICFRLDAPTNYLTNTTYPTSLPPPQPLSSQQTHT